jgi:hypothetical protein
MNSTLSKAMLRNGEEIVSLQKVRRLASRTIKNAEKRLRKHFK